MTARMPINSSRLAFGGVVTDEVPVASDSAMTSCAPAEGVAIALVGDTESSGGLSPVVGVGAGGETSLGGSVPVGGGSAVGVSVLVFPGGDVAVGATVDVASAVSDGVGDAVAVAGATVAVGVTPGAGVSVGGMGVLVGPAVGPGVLVGGAGVLVGGEGVLLGVSEGVREGRRVGGKAKAIWLLASDSNGSPETAPELPFQARACPNAITCVRNRITISVRARSCLNIICGTTILSLVLDDRAY